jgi:hypothetical protein
MALRIESERPYLEDNNGSDNITTSTVLPELSTNLYSASSESDDGLDQEIGALKLFEVNLKYEIDKASNTTLLQPLTSPIHTVLSSKSSNCSINTTFLSEYNEYGSHSSDEILFRVRKNVRRVHFNEHVEEFLYAAHEACGTPDAKSSDHSHKNTSFVDEIYGVFDDILDEINNACISFSNAMDRTKQINKYGEIRRSSVH